MLIIRIKDRWSETGTRRINVKNRVTRDLPWNKYAPWMHNAQAYKDVFGVQHAFRAGRSQVTNALAHVGRNFTMTMRLALFDNLTADRCIPILVAAGILKGWGFTEQAYPGQPNTGAISNIMAAPMDNEISRLNVTSRFGRLFVYTRYAEAMYFSYDGADTGTMLRAKAIEIAERHGLKINDQHTRVQAAVAGRRIVSGIAVGDKLYTSRKRRRKIRAEAWKSRIKLKEIIKDNTLTPPKGYEPERIPLNVKRYRGKIVVGSLTLIGGTSDATPTPTPTTPPPEQEPPVRKARKFDL